MILPASAEELGPWAEQRIAECRTSVSQRSAMARQLRTWRYTGSPDGNSAILNRLNHQVDRMASYLYSPTNLRFRMGYKQTRDAEFLDMAEAAGRVLTEDFARQNIDLDFAEGVDIALTYGACIPKMLWTDVGLTCNLVMPWQFGVYQENKIGLEKQEAMVETQWITPSELWRRISHMKDAQELFRRAQSYANSGSGVDESELGYFHQVLIAGSQPSVQTEMPYTTQTGGMVSLAADPGGAQLDPDVASKLMAFHELWVRDDITGDYTTIQMIAPDIVIAPKVRRTNMFVPKGDGHPRLPYSLIQPNRFNGYFWGRTEMADLLKLQLLLRDRLDDLKKIMGMQYDRLLSFIGNTGVTEESYDQFRQSGWMSQENGDVKDLTPPVPKEAFMDIQQIMNFMDEVTGFTPILSGQATPGVRADNQAQTLMRNASPRMRDRALIVERQCADLGDTALTLLAAKDATIYRTAAATPAEFRLAQIPNDRRVMVDSHSSSPIYEEDNMQKVGFLAKLGFIDGEETIDAMNMQQGDLWKERLRKKQVAQAEQMKQLQQNDPEAYAKVLAKGKK